MKNKERSLKYHLISPEVHVGSPATLRAVVETPRGSRHKFALDPKIGALVLRQTLASGLSWPYDYGFVPQTSRTEAYSPEYYVNFSRHCFGADW